MFQDLYSWNTCISTSPITPPFPGVYCRTLLHSLNSHISLMHKKEGGNWQLFSPLLSHQVSILSSLRHKVCLYISVSLTKSLLETGNCLCKSIYMTAQIIMPDYKYYYTFSVGLMHCTQNFLMLKSIQTLPKSVLLSYPIQYLFLKGRHLKIHALSHSIFHQLYFYLWG